MKLVPYIYVRSGLATVIWGLFLFNMSLTLDGELAITNFVRGTISLRNFLLGSH